MGVSHLSRLTLIVLIGCGGATSGRRDAGPSPDAADATDLDAAADATDAPNPDAAPVTLSDAGDAAATPSDASDGGMADASGGAHCPSFGDSCGPLVRCCEGVCSGNFVCVGGQQ